MKNNITKGLMEALCKWQEKKPAIDLDGKNPHFKSKYATLSNIISKVKPALTECGLSYTQIMTDGKIATMIFHAESDGVIVSERPIPDYNKVQDEGSYITYQKRYQLCAMLGIAGEDDSDGNDVDKSKSTPAKPRATVANIHGAVNHEKVGMKAGNMQVLDQMIAKYTLDATQVRELVHGEILHIAEKREEVIELLTTIGYTITLEE